MYYIYGISGPSLHVESTDSMIYIYIYMCVPVVNSAIGCFKFYSLSG